MGSLRRFRDLSLRIKLLGLLILVLTTGMAIFTIGYALTERKALKESTIRRFAVLAEVAAENVNAAVQFEVAADAQAILDSLKAHADVRIAVIYQLEGDVFVFASGEDVRQPSEAPPFTLVGWESIEDSVLKISRPIKVDGEAVASVYLEVGLDELGEATRRMTVTAAVLFAVSLLVSLPLAAWLQHLLTLPIQQLLAVTRRVALNKDYSLRAPKDSDDEIGKLVNGFNHMLEQIARRDERLSDLVSELKRSNAELDEFAYIASHDLKSPLRGIKNLASWIAEDAEETLPDSSKAHLAKLQTRVMRMEQLLEDLLAYSRAGRMHREVEEVDVDALISELVDLHIPPSFVVKIPPGLPKLQTQKTPLELCLRNLLSNAVKHHDREDGRIEIGFKDADQIVEITVADDGPGIPPEFHEKVFQMFQTLQSRDKTEGSGMGLALVNKLATSVGGRVSLESRLGSGAKFRLKWPKRIG